MQRSWFELLARHAVLLLAVPLLVPVRSDPAQGPPLLQTDFDTAATGAFCSDGIQSGQTVHACSLVDPGYVTGSAADLLMASRFKGFSAGKQAWSTDPNTVGLLADYTFTLQTTSQRLDASKDITATGQKRLPPPPPPPQLDLFLCGDDTCKAMADLMYITAAGDAPSTPATLTFGYSRLANTLAALPTRYLDPAALTSTLVPDAAAASPVSVPGAQLNTVVWQIEDPEWVANYPTLLNAASLARTLAIGGADWDAVRAGRYRDARGVCVTVLSPVHPWFDAMGWGASDDCAPTETYVFDSYFPQAYLDLDSGAPYDVAYNSSSSSWDTHAYVYNLAPPARATPWGWRASQLASVVARGELIDAGPGAMGRAVCCPLALFENKEVAAAGAHDCEAAHQAYCFADPARNAWADAPLPPLLQAPLLPQARHADVLRIGAATFVAWNLTERAAAGRDALRHLQFARFDVWEADIDYLQPDAADHADERLPYAVQMLTKLAVMAKWPDPLPWCDETNELGYGAAQGALKAERSYVRVPPAAAGGAAAAGVYSLYDCEAMWPLLGWGRVDTDLQRRRPAVTGTAIFNDVARPSWANVTDDTGLFAASTGTGFAGYPSLSTAAVEAGARTAALSAGVLLGDFAALEVSSTDFTVTLAGAFIALSLTAVSLIAGYIARADLLHFFMRCRLGVAAAKAFAILITTFALITYPITVIIAENGARAGNPDGTTATVRWVEGDAAGVGTYKVIGTISMTSEAQYSDAAYVIVWLNLALTLLFTAGIARSYYTASFNKREVLAQELSAPVSRIRFDRAEPTMVEVEAQKQAPHF
ncbi:hypothetical protein JKP88DRAFT_307316 [Tribonema minus]|uniref:Uncharacterized protein n=1 Tax=Tribonema minus TaxID=303371 RepID=A0A836CJG8_9STRA|nr:hypothetical protein JKP88DRAFT_307316 [Tribonema minus]